MAYPDLYKRSIFFEIRSLNQDGTPGKFEESFAFTIPPSSIEIIQPQRVTSTPTPGGYFVDNYGLDGAKISIGGETGNEESRLTIFGAGRVPGTFTGQEVYFEFKKRIVEYSLRKKNYAMYFYDLTNKRANNNILGDEFGKVVQYSEAWEVVLDESALRKTSSKPFWYPYTINLTGIRKLGTFDPGATKTEVGLISDIKGLINAAAEAVEAFNDNMDAIADNITSEIANVASIKDSTSAFTDQLTRFTDSVIEYEQKLAGLFDSVLSVSENILNKGIQFIQFPYDVLETARVEYLTLEERTSDLIESIQSSGDDIIDYYDWEKLTTPTSEISEGLIEIQDPLFQMVLTAKQDSSYEPIGAVSINGTVVPVYGLTTIIIQENTRLDILARDLFGDPEFKDVISALNRIYSTDELVVGDTLTIPLLTPEVRYATNAVYNVPGEL